VPEREVVHRHRERRERAGAGRVDDGVRAAHVEAVGDAPRDHVAEEPGEGRLLPRHVLFVDLLGEARDLGVREAGLAHRVLPHGLLQAPRHLRDELGGRGHAEEHAHAALVDGLPLATRRLFEGVLRHDEREELRRVRGGQRVRRHAELHRREVDLGEEAAARRVDLVLRAGLLRVVVVAQPVRARHLGEAVLPFDDVFPERERVFRSREESAHADDGDGGHEGIGGGLLAGLHGCSRSSRRGEAHGFPGGSTPKRHRLSGPGHESRPWLNVQECSPFRNAPRARRAPGGGRFVTRSAARRVTITSYMSYGLPGSLPGAGLAAPFPSERASKLARSAAVATRARARSAA
jgi:hypothetical protein